MPLAFKVRFPGDSQSLGWISSLGNLLCALEVLQKCKNVFGIIVLLFVGRLLNGSMVRLMATSSRRTKAILCASQLCCNQNLVPATGHCWPMPPQEMLKHSKAGLAQSSVGVTAPFPGSWCAQGFCLHPLSICGRYEVWFLNVISPLLPSCWGFPFALGCEVSFSGGIQFSPVDGCSAAGCDFGVLAGEDEHMSYSSTLFRLSGLGVTLSNFSKWSTWLLCWK